MKPRHKRIAIVVGGLAALGVATALVLNALESNLVFFYSPSQIEAKEAPVARSFRLGGMVKQGSVQRDGLNVNFIVTDTVKTTPVRYAGILPDLFKEGKGVVAQGKLENGVFVAKEVLAKHDENYMPPEAADAIAKAKAQSGPQSAGTLAPAGGKPEGYGNSGAKPPGYGNSGDPR